MQVVRVVLIGGRYRYTLLREMGREVYWVEAQDTVLVKQCLLHGPFTLVEGEAFLAARMRREEEMRRG